MFKEKSVKNEQISFRSPFAGLSPAKAERLKNSWAGTFYEEVYSKVEEAQFAPLYSEIGSRPNIPIRLLVSALILKEFQHCSDEELIENLEWNRKYQLALDLNDQEDLPFSMRTLTRFRTKLVNYEVETGVDLVHSVIKPLLDNFCQKMAVNNNRKRMDSFQIASNIKKLTRAEIIFETNRKCLKALEKAGVVIPEELAHYLTPFEHNQVFYHDKTLNYEERLLGLISDIFLIRELFKGAPVKLKEADLLERLIKEQLIKENGSYRLKADKSEGLNSQTMQSPHDPDATYRNKKGNHVGYVGNIEEVACEDGSMISDYQYQQNSYSDSQFMKDFIQKEAANSSKDEITVVTDGAYASVENSELAEASGINHVATDLVGKKTNDLYADFIFNDDGTEILMCPNGIIPLKNSYQPSSGQVRALFNRSICVGCPYYPICHPRLQKKTAVRQVSLKSSLRAKARRKQSGKTFNRQRNFRNGVEAIPSVMRNKFNIDRMPVRGLIRTRQLFGFKIAGLAMTKFLRYEKRKSEREVRCASNQL